MAGDLAVLVLCDVFSEIPDVALVVLSVPVIGLFDQLAILCDPVARNPALNSHDALGVVGHGHHVTLGGTMKLALVDKGRARLKRVVFVVYLRGEIGGVDVGRVGCLRRFDATGVATRVVGEATASCKEHDQHPQNRAEWCDPFHGRFHLSPGNS